ncbi:MAG TPA: cation diffusion facilitator family transporter [Candidatus Binatia bacterium]|nr:cation diffusion facilitator family transporter [Candidatus Binatia bacterium]
MYEHDHHSHDRSPARNLSVALVTVLVFAFVEAGTGWWAGSLALLSDAGHMLTDSGALALAVFASWFARQPADAEHTWGHGRAEVLAAIANAVLMMGLVVGIVIGALDRFQHPAPVRGGAVIAVALGGLVVNLAVLRTLTHGGPQTLNTRAAMLHVVGDALGSVAAVVSGIVIITTGWTPIDPLLSMLICLLIVVSGWQVLRDSLNVVMEAVPSHLKTADIGRAMAAVPGVAAIHDLHIWRVTSDRIALSAHVVLRDMGGWLAVLAELNAVLRRDYGIDHATLQPEPLGEAPLTRRERADPGPDSGPRRHPRHR